MGKRRKFVYREGKIIEVLTGDLVKKWNAASGSIDPSEYMTELQTKNGEKVSILEDEDGAWICEEKKKICLSGGFVRLPKFEGCRYAPLLRALHNEILVNVVNG